MVPSARQSRYFADGFGQTSCADNSYARIAFKNDQGKHVACKFSTSATAAASSEFRLGVAGQRDGKTRRKNRHSILRVPLSAIDFFQPVRKLTCFGPASFDEQVQNL